MRYRRGDPYHRDRLLKDIAKPAALFVSPVILPVITPPRPLIKALEDRREFNPLGVLRPAAALRRTSRQIVVRNPPNQPARASLPSRLSFSYPPDISLCVRRKERREVLFAKRKARGSHARKRRNWFSFISC